MKCHFAGCAMKAIVGLSMASAIFVASPAIAQTAQLIVTGTPGSDGSYAAVTYDTAPSNVSWTTPIVQGNFFVYDGVDCTAHTLTKPVAGSGAGKVALLTGSYPSSCTYYDDIVRELQADGVVAVVFGFANGSWRTRILHGNATGLTVPVLYMQVDEVTQSIRSAVLGGATVGAAFVAVPGMAMQEVVDWFLPGQTRPLSLVPLGSPSTGANWAPTTLDLDRTTAGIQQSFTFSGTSACAGVSYNWNAATPLLTGTVPAGSTYTGTCAKTYLIRDTAGYQDIGLVTLYIGVPFVRNDVAHTVPGAPVAIDVLANDYGDPSIKVASRIDLVPSTVAIDQSVDTAQGTWSVVGSAVTFVPADGFNGSASNQYVVRGANGGSSNVATVTVIVGLAALPAAERAVLTNLYESTNGASWTNHGNWNGVVGTECTWYGVTCDAGQTTVTSINLSNNNLTGTLPNDLNNLTKLAFLFVWSNHLTGAIPALTGLTKLQIFNVESNQLTGPIPSLTGLSNLQGFLVGANQLTGPIPSLTGLTKLTLFSAGANQLTGSIPALAGLTKLAHFSVGGNKLTGSIPSLTGLTNLTSFYVFGNQLTGSIPALDGLTKLTGFTVGDNRLTGNMPPVPSPSALSAGGSALCPNFLNPTPDAAWDIATGVTPWYGSCTAAPPVLDVDASLSNTKYEALSDGVLVIRYLFGLTGTPLTTGALGATATRSDPTAIKAYLDGMRTVLDVDGSGTADALTDGLLIVRYLFGLRGDALIAGAIDPLATRKTDTDIEGYIQSLMP